MGIGGGDEEIVIEVRDRGPGLPGAVALFEPFVRGPGATPRGAGLGLAICRAVAGVHAGRVWADPRPGGGAIFGVALPDAAPSAPLDYCDTGAKPQAPWIFATLAFGLPVALLILWVWLGG